MIFMNDKVNLPFFFRLSIPIESHFKKARIKI